jgi:hypothetical protein
LDVATDSVGRHWGWQDGRTCAFKGPRGEPLRAAGAVATAWEAAPRCAAERTASNSVKDSSARWWGWQGGKSCKFLA